MHRSLILMKNPGQIIPDEMLRLAVKEFPSCLGSALVTENEGEGKVLLIGHEMVQPTLETINLVQKNYQAGKILFYLGNFPDGSLNDDIQPFRMKAAENDDDLIVAFLDGEFVGFQKTNSSHSTEMHCVETALSPLITKVYDQAGGDLNKFSELLNDPLYEVLLTQLSANRGTICILTAADRLHTFHHGELRKTFPWGWTSQHLGYGEKPTTVEPAKTVVPVVSKRPKLFGAAVITAPAEAVAAPEAPAVTAKGTASEAVLSTKTQADAEAADEYLWGKPPNNKTDDGAIKSWYRQNSYNGKCPNDWKDRPKVRLKIKKTTIAETTSISPANKPGPEALPVITPDETKRLHDWLAKKGKITYDPAKIQALETSAPNFEERTGKKLEEFQNWDYALCVELGNTVGVPTLAAMAMQFKQMYFATLATPTEEATPAVAPAVAEVPKQRKKLFG